MSLNSESISRAPKSFFHIHTLTQSISYAAQSSHCREGCGKGEPRCNTSRLRRTKDRRVQYRKKSDFASPLKYVLRINLGHLWYCTFMTILMQMSLDILDMLHLLHFSFLSSMTTASNLHSKSVCTPKGLQDLIRSQEDLQQIQWKLSVHAAITWVCLKGQKGNKNE